MKPKYKRLLLFIAIVVFSTWLVLGQEKEPCYGQSWFVGSGAYLIKIPTKCGGTWYRYCDLDEATWLIDNVPQAQCISFLCPGDGPFGAAPN